MKKQQAEEHWFSSLKFHSVFIFTISFDRKAEIAQCVYSRSMPGLWCSISASVLLLLWHVDLDYSLMGSCKEEISSLLPFLSVLVYKLRILGPQTYQVYSFSSFCLVQVKPIPLLWLKWGTYLSRFTQTMDKDKCRHMAVGVRGLLLFPMIQTTLDLSGSRIPKALRYSIFVSFSSFSPSRSPKPASDFSNNMVSKNPQIQPFSVFLFTTLQIF